MLQQHNPLIFVPEERFGSKSFFCFNVAMTLNDHIKQLHSEDARVRRDAAQALGQLGDIEAIPTLIIAADDDNITVARTAVLALGRIGGRDVIDPLLTALQHDSLWVRRAAVQALGMSGAESTVPYLVNALADEDLYHLAREALKALHVDPDYF